ncbi:hypothetical protein PXK58_20940 [Phaeobacter gallaeciensis]|uniref:hypothetical protein n=1 Tax=Phaeobacter gallaeciensis TaxID=60890 RepID=UPI0023806398|nr:hypothetical protein [Phaeobacter gallaeciensis]MDE4276776.1 hypothetical protein [Phaeobacter gallaeciensis]MDE4301995.1 hypothetical protein [Phaeobacter gallaeciensis]MDE5187200.1 hypothetical protein [Phaeobacter gallaeciensis]
MKVDYSVSSTSVTLNATDVHTEALPKISAVATNLNSVIQSLGNAIEDLHEDSEIDDGRRKAMMALVLKLEILAANLGSQSDVLEQLRCQEISPSDAGFPEFEYPDY